MTRQFGQLIAVSAALVMMSGCASVTISMPGSDGVQAEQKAAKVGHSERIALQEAAARLDHQPYGDVHRASFTAAMLGKLRLSEREQAVLAYVDRVSAESADPVAAVLNDADQALAQARYVAEMGRQASTAITPVANDIATLETAIGRVRECREMYVDALKVLQRRGADLSRNDITVVREAFTQTIVDIGQTADHVAAQVDANAERERFAQNAADEAETVPPSAE